MLSPKPLIVLSDPEIKRNSRYSEYMGLVERTKLPIREVPYSDLSEENITGHVVIASEYLRIPIKNPRVDWTCLERKNLFYPIDQFSESDFKPSQTPKEWYGKKLSRGSAEDRYHLSGIILYERDKGAFVVFQRRDTDLSKRLEGLGVKLERI